MANNTKPAFEKKYFALKLIAPRNTFVQDMTEEERKIMQSHLEYWKGLMSKGTAIVFGPVFDPKGVYGLGIVAVESEEQVKDITENDPANGLHRYEFYPMLAVLPQH